MNRRSSKVAGVPQRLGKRAPRPGKDGFRKADVKDTIDKLNAYLGQPPRRKRAKPVFSADGRVPNLATHVLTKLRAASRSPRGKGMCCLSRAELEVVLQLLERNERTA